MTVACYAVYRGANPRLLDFFRQEALRNADIAIGIDIMFLKQSCRGREKTLRSILFSIREAWRDFAWYVMMLGRGHLVLPLPALVSLLDCFQYQHKDICYPPYNTVAKLYSSSWPDTATANEIMATYLRFVASPSETYGLKPYDSRFLKLLRRSHYYSKLVNSVFAALKPRLYLTPYSGYLHYQAPCKAAAHYTVPTLVLGCSDCLYRVRDHEQPRQFISASRNQAPVPDTFSRLSAIGSRIMTRRIEGARDSSISYMEVSAYASTDAHRFWAFPATSEHLGEVSQSTLLSFGNQGFVCVFMHELNDWHHNGVLPPFASSYYEWLFLTLSFLNAQKINYIVKVHPCIVNAPPSYADSINALLGLASQLGRTLPVTTLLTTTQLIDSGIKLGVTVRGTVALELAYLRQPFLCAGYPPYASLFPDRTTSCINSYQERLLNYLSEPAVSEEEAKSSAYYIALQEQASIMPDVDLKSLSLDLSDCSSYQSIKKLL
jgi:hypothetical protein